ncbi:DUF6538 domain-containing protein [Ahrensia sp. 13_GOM-1096m]|uniref:DUF6538 domain-containing protein n=1 Tax=Ahrensia sp. 13_GOM-1096m TaxID=1380380 RepID=UPI000A5DA877|nr:DUF6538 domain-containing protein [Ahrensia sp. 13_GOM-1096m]
MTNNLIRRGKTYYWRARIPSSLATFSNCTHLCLSLKTQDLQQAECLARRLNLKRDEMSLFAPEKLITKNDLTTIFKVERERYDEKIGRIATCARLNVQAHNPEELEADHDNGWAYMVAAVFGHKVSTNFSPDCHVGKYLMRSGVPKSRIKGINMCYGLIHQRFSYQPSIDRIANPIIQRLGVELTALNQQAILTEIFKARAQTLLDYEKRWPAIDPAILEDTHSDLGNETNPAINTTIDDMLKSALATAEPANADITNGIEPQTPIIQQHFEQTHASHDSTAYQNTPLPDGLTDISTSDFDHYLDDLCEIKDADGQWDAKTKQQARQTIKLFRAILDEAEVTHTSEIRQKHVKDFSQFLRQIHKDYGRSIRSDQPYPTPAQLRSRAAYLKKQGAKTGLSAPTIRRHFVYVQAFEKHLRSAGVRVIKFDYDGLLPPKKSKSQQNAASPKPELDKLEGVFKLPPFTGCKSELKQSYPGNEVYHTGVYWCMLALVYTACRRGEIAQLDVKDIEEIDGIPIIHFRNSETKRVKNISSIRKIPVPREMLRLGFLDYVSKIKKLGYEKLFPDLFHAHIKNDPGERIYHILDKSRKAYNAEHTAELISWDRMLHAIRHGINTALYRAGVSSEDRRTLMGQTGASTNEIVYTGSATPQQIRDVMDKLPIITAHLKARPINLLPWIAEKRIAPWGRIPALKKLN